MDHFVVVYQSSCKHTKDIAHEVSEGSGAELVPVRDDGFIDYDGWKGIFLARTVIFGLHDMDSSFLETFRRRPQMPTKRFAVFSTCVGENLQSRETLECLYALAVRLNWIYMGSWIIGTSQNVDKREAIEPGIDSSAVKAPEFSKIMGVVWPDDGYNFGKHMAACSDKLSTQSGIGV